MPYNTTFTFKAALQTPDFTKEAIAYLCQSVGHQPKKPPA